jgi:phospholipase/carboxylesterase
MMTMYTMPRRAKPCAGALCYSGALIDDGTIDTAPENLTKVPIVLVHGKEDDVVPFNAFDHAGGFLQKAGFDVRGYACEGLGHSIDANGVKQGMDFLQSVLYPQAANQPLRNI